MTVHLSRMLFCCLIESSSEMTRWIAAFSPVSSEEEDEKLYSETDG